MFRPMRRNKQQLAEDEALEVLKNAKRGVLSVIGDGGWPYGIHLNPYWEDGKLYRCIYHVACTYRPSEYAAAWEEVTAE